jgi:uncharacterized protein (DUF1330 family)
MRTCFAMAISLVIGLTAGIIGSYSLMAQTKPPAYVVAEIDVHDPANYAKEYLSRSAKPINQDGGGKFLSRGNNAISIRGEPPKRIVIFAFESLDRAKEAFASQGYAEAYAHGEKYAKFRIYAVEGIAP